MFNITVSVTLVLAHNSHSHKPTGSILNIVINLKLTGALNTKACFTLAT